MRVYHEFLYHILTNGTPKDDRTGTGTLSVFGYQMRFDLQKGFPLVTTKKLHTKSIIHELIWFLSGSTNVSYLQQNGVKIWDAWCDKDGNLGPVYGKQWRSWACPDGSTIDQISKVVEQIKTNPNSRRHIVVAYNPADVDKMALPPCHSFFQFYVSEGKLSCQLYQRSADAFLGVPFNITSYALLTHMIAQVTGLEVGDFIHTIGDGHIYKNHIEQVKLQLTREHFALPKVELNPEIKNILDFRFEDVTINGYVAHPSIKGNVAV